VCAQPDRRRPSSGAARPAGWRGHQRSGATRRAAPHFVRCSAARTGGAPAARSHPGRCPDRRLGGPAVRRAL
jgi:hypothetical protein